MTLADRMVVMNAGVADQIGAPLDVYAHPQTTFVAGFIGSPPTNFLDANRFGRGQKGFQIGIRPEHINISETGMFEASVLYAEPLGAETLVHVRGQDGTQITVRQDGALPIPAEGDGVALGWSTTNEMLFDASGLKQ